MRILYSFYIRHWEPLILRNPPQYLPRDPIMRVFSTSIKTPVKSLSSLYISLLIETLEISVLTVWGASVVRQSLFKTKLIDNGRFKETHVFINKTLQLNGLNAG